MGNGFELAKNLIRDMRSKNEYSLTFFPAPGREKCPFAVICPGGGYSAVMSSLEGAPYARALNAKGFSAFVLRYQAKELAKNFQPQKDLARAVREILDNATKYNVLRKGYSVWGSSAGGHLAATFGTKSLGYAHYALPKPATLVLAYPVVTMGQFTHKGSKKWLIGKQAAPELIKLTSVEENITPDYPPTFLWCCKPDRVVNPLNSEMLAEALKTNSVPHRFMAFETGEHGAALGIGTECEVWLDAAVEFWKTRLKNNAVGGEEWNDFQ
jgi:acetyl esterase/lipase